MKLKRITYVIAGLVLTVSFIFTGLTACSTDIVAPQGNPPISTSTPKLTPATPPPSNATPTLYPEPSVKPAGLPLFAKWNPETGHYYDPSEFEWDPVTHKYKDLPHPTPSEILNGKVATQTVKEWITQHQNSTDEVDVALLNYRKALTDYGNSLTQEERLRVAIRSDWTTFIGPAEGGPLEILKDLGIPRLQKLVDRVQWDNPLCIDIENAVCLICRDSSTKIGGWDYQILQWKKEFNDTASMAKSQVDGIAQELAGNQADEKATRIKFAQMGIFALPEVYELVVNQGNTTLIKYLPDILPLDKMKSYNIQAGKTDDTTLKQALKSCVDDIKIIQTLHTN